jgi:RNA polymerase primary sigma factor
VRAPAPELEPELETSDAPERRSEVGEEEERAPTRSSPSGFEGRMPLYARAISSHVLLTAAGERSLAQQIEERSAATWTAALSHPSMAEYVSERAIERIPAARRALARVRRAAAGARADRDRASRTALVRAAERAGRAMHALDVDHQVIDEIVARAARAADQPDRAQHLPVKASTRAFSAYASRLSHRARQVTEARHRFAQANIGLVFHVAARYRTSSVGLPDLVQEGTLGLLKAVDRFDHRKGFRFSTYATWWIRHAIGRAVADKSRLVRVPVHIQEAHQRLNQVRRKLAGELARDPSAEELAEAAGLSPDRLEIVREAVGGGEISLDERFGDDEDRARLDVFSAPDQDLPDPQEELDLRTMTRAARRHMASLTPQEFDIPRKRFALDEIDHEWSLQEIADEYGLSRERIRQIQERALRKLRAGLDQDQPRQESRSLAARAA